MRPDPWPMVRDRVRALARSGGRLLVVTDFDGTLAPIVPDPMGARIEPGARSALHRLARVAHAHPRRLALAVLSGRAAADVARRVRVGGIRYLGNHGLESGVLRRGDPAERLLVTSDPILAVGADPAAIAALGVAVRERLDRPAWLFVEDKGPSVAFHFRQAADPGAARIAVNAALDALERDSSADEPDRASRPGEGRWHPSLERLEGRQVVEVRPRGAGGKGAATVRLIASERPTAILALGDDVSDADAFRAVIDAADTGRAGGPGPTHRLVIAVHGAAETPQAVLDAADLLVAAPREAARALAELGRVLIAEDDTGAAIVRAAGATKGTRVTSSVAPSVRGALRR